MAEEPDEIREVRSLFAPYAPQSRRLARSFTPNRGNYIAFIDRAYGNLWKSQPFVALLDATAREDIAMVNAILTIITPTQLRQEPRYFTYGQQIAYLDNVTLLRRYLQFSPSLSEEFFLSAAHCGVKTLIYFFDNYKPTDFLLQTLELVFRVVIHRNEEEVHQTFLAWIDGMPLFLPPGAVVTFTRNELMRDVQNGDDLNRIFRLIVRASPAAYLDFPDLFTYNNFLLLGAEKREELHILYERPLLKEWFIAFAPRVLALFSADYTRQQR